MRTPRASRTGARRVPHQKEGLVSASSLECKQVSFERVQALLNASRSLSSAFASPLSLSLTRDILPEIESTVEEPDSTVGGATDVRDAIASPLSLSLTRDPEALPARLSCV